MSTKNRVVLVVSQEIPQSVNKAGNIVSAFTNKAEFVSETMQEVSVENVAAWAITAIENYLGIARLRGKTGFKMSKELDISLTVNNRTGVTGMKFSMNADRLARVFERTPQLFDRVFRPLPNVGGLTINKAMSLVFNGGKRLLATAAKKNEPKLIAEHIAEPVVPVEQEPVDNFLEAVE